MVFFLQLMDIFNKVINMSNPKNIKVNMKKFWKNLNKSQNKQNKIIKEICKNG